MIKCTKIKKVLKNSVFPILTGINKLIPKDDQLVLLYSPNKGIGYNLKPLRDYMIEHEYIDQYQIVCCVSSPEYFEDDGLRYVTQGAGILLFLKAKHVFYTAGQIPIKPSKQQIVIHMNHGTTDYKTLGALTKIDNGDEFYFTYFLASSPLYVPILAKEYRCPERNVIVCNEPMTERIYIPQNKYDFGGYKKVLLWVPTFRQSDYLGYDDSSTEALVPLFSEDEYGEINEALSKYDMLLIVKLHPCQSVHGYKRTAFSNFILYSHEDFIEAGFELYDLMGQVDGLIGDYSSASLQFLLTGKPLAYVIPDYEEYAQKRGFVFDDPKHYMPGHIITTKEEFFSFLSDFANGNDPYPERRKEIRDEVHFYQDCNSCSRILSLSGMK